MKERIRRFVSGLEVDDVGFAAVSDYCSPLSPPLGSIFPGAQSEGTRGAVGQVSLRHAAAAAGLGAFGGNNLVIHPRFGCRTVFSAILTDLDIPQRVFERRRFQGSCGEAAENFQEVKICLTCRSLTAASSTPGNATTWGI